MLVDNVVNAYLNDNPNTGSGVDVAALDANTTATDANTNALNASAAITTNNIDILTANTDATTGNTNELSGLKASIDANTAALKSGGSVTQGEFTGEVNYTDIGTGYVDGLGSTLTNLLSPDNPDNQTIGTFIRAISSNVIIPPHIQCRWTMSGLTSFILSTMLLKPNQEGLKSVLVRSL